MSIIFFWSASVSVLVETGPFVGTVIILAAKVLAWHMVGWVIIGVVLVLVLVLVLLVEVVCWMLIIFCEAACKTENLPLWLEIRHGWVRKNQSGCDLLSL